MFTRPLAAAAAGAYGCYIYIRLHIRVYSMYVIIRSGLTTDPSRRRKKGGSSSFWAIFSCPLRCDLETGLDLDGD